MNQELRQALISYFQLEIVSAAEDDEDGVWRTINGTPVFIKEGESVDEAMDRQFKGKQAKPKTTVKGNLDKTTKSFHDSERKRMDDTIRKNREILVNNKKLLDEDPSNAAMADKIDMIKQQVARTENNAINYKERLDWRENTANVETLSDGKTNLYSDDGVPDITKNYVKEQYSKLTPDVQANIKAIELHEGEGPSVRTASGEIGVRQGSWQKDAHEITVYNSEGVFGSTASFEHEKGHAVYDTLDSKVRSGNDVPFMQERAHSAFNRWASGNNAVGGEVSTYAKSYVDAGVKNANGEVFAELTRIRETDTVRYDELKTKFPAMIDFHKQILTGVFQDES